jgi:hypothetical protein
MASKTRKRRPSARRMTAGAAPVVEDARLPRMGEREMPPLRIGGRILLMQEQPPPDDGTRNRMAAFRRTSGSAETRMPKAGYPAQQPPKPPRRTRPTRRAAKQPREGYVRLRVLVDDGEMSIVGAKFVEGPLAAVETLPPGLVYEVTLGSRRIATGAIPDAGVWRSFPDPLGRPALEGHHITVTPRYEIAVRVPAEEMTISGLARMRIALYRWRGPGRVAPVAGRSLASQLKGRVDRIAALSGIRMTGLSRQAQAELRKALE